MYNNKHFVYSEYTPSNFGIDKVRLYTRDYQIKNTTCLGIQPNTKKQGETDTEPTLLFHSDGEPIYGAKAFHNTEDINLDINRLGLSVLYNPTNYGGNNTLTAKPDELKYIAKDIEDYLQTIGVELSLDNTKITRLDTAKDSQMNKDVYLYNGAFATLNGKRTKQRVMYPDGYRLGNTQRQGIFYDKGKEQTGVESNNMRCEYKALKAKEVQRSYGGIAYLKDLHKVTARDIEYFYKMNLSNHVLVESAQQRQLQLKFSDVHQIGKIVQNSRYYTKDLFALLGGAEGIVTRFGTLDNYRAFLINNGVKRPNAHKQVKEVQAYLQQANRFSTSTIGEDLEEIKQKFVA